MKMYSPFAPVCTSRVALVASLTNCTVAAGTAPPLGSTTVPRMRPPVLCAPAGGAAGLNAIAKSAADRMLRQHTERSCRNRASTFIPSPLAAKNLFEDQFFVVAVPLKPYY